jgi:N-acetyl-beta-hexosaminidase
MINEDKKIPQQDQSNVKSAQYENTPQNVIYNAARFNKQFLDSQLDGNLLL